MHDLTTPEGVTAHMSEATSEDDWNKRCDQVQAANGGNYPDFWYETVILSGLLDKTLGPGSSDIRFVSL